MITEKEQEKTLDNLYKQLLEIKKQILLDKFYKIKVTCPDCNRKIGMINLYRCFCCGLWICKNCGPKHFDINESEIPRYIK